MTLGDLLEQFGIHPISNQIDKYELVMSYTVEGKYPYDDQEYERYSDIESIELDTLTKRIIFKETKGK